MLNVGPHRVKRSVLLGEPVVVLLGVLGSKGAEKAVPHDEDAGVVAVSRRAMVHAVVGGCVEDVLERPDATDELGVNPELA